MAILRSWIGSRRAIRCMPIMGLLVPPVPLPGKGLRLVSMGPSRWICGVSVMLLAARRAARGLVATHCPWQVVVNEGQLPGAVPDPEAKKAHGE
jgi:hypothetical protein